MNILMISDVYFPRVNGVSTSIATFRRKLLDSGHRVCLIVPDYRKDIADDPDIIRIPSRHLWLDPEDRMMKVSAIYALVDELQQRKFDVLHIQTPFVAHHVGIRLARQLGVPVVESYHTYFEEYLHHYIRFLPRALTKAAARHVTRIQCNRLDVVIVPSSAMRDVMQEYGVSTPTTIIPTGVEPELFSGGSGSRFRQQHGIAPDRPVLVHIGRVAYEKNIDFLLDVVARVRQDFRDVLLVIAGEGPARRSLQARVAREGLQHSVLFVDYLPRGAPLWDCFRAGDLFVFASSTETQGLVLLEAMALGIPVISTAVMGTRDILLAGRGCRIAEPVVRHFALQVTELLESPGQRARLAREAVSYAGEWSSDNMTGRLVECYGNLARQSHARRDKRTGPLTASS